MRRISRYTIQFLLCLAIAASADWVTFCQLYGLLTTVAGKGVLGGGGENYWLAGFEGGPAVNAELSNPHMAMADSAGNIFIADKEAHAIRKVDVAGNITTAAGTNSAGDGGDGRATDQSLNSPNGVWVNKKGDFYVLDLGNGKIRKVTTDGMMTTIVSDPLGMSVGRGLWVSVGEDTIWYACGSEIKMWTRQAGIVTYATDFSALGNIVQDRNGYIVATDRSANKVYRIDSHGQKTVIAGNGQDCDGSDGSPALECCFYGVRAVWFLDDNSYFLGTHEGSQVWYVDTAGIAHLFLDGRKDDNVHSGDNEYYHSPGDKVSEVRAVTVDYRGNVIITENDRGFVRRVAKGTVAAYVRRVAVHQESLKLCARPVAGGLLMNITAQRDLRAMIDVVDLHGQTVVGRAIRRRLPVGTTSMSIPCRFAHGGTYVVSVDAEGLKAIRQVVVVR